jgi:phosphoribosylaminoimidazole carboxylase/phosphoribosylaminoimidazole-succinocarboxamide synthase
MTEIKKGKKIASGKTKDIYEVDGDPSLVILENKDDITKNDDPDQTMVMKSKAFHATKTTSFIFQLLKDAGLPVAFKKQLSPTEFLAPKCQMIPLEVIIRRYAVGSYLKRYPNLEKTGNPLRFHKLVFELFLKTTLGKISTMTGEMIGELPFDILETEKKKFVDDPFIATPYEKHWVLKHPKIPGWDSRSGMNLTVNPEEFLPNEVTVEMIEEITRQAFLVIEAAWANLGMRLIDFKIEFGVDTFGHLYIADVIDNDSWRLRTIDWKETSKQLFRDNESLAIISEKYALVSGMVERFFIPKQAIVVWCGSEKDKVPEIPLAVAGVEMITVVASGHKSPQKVINKLEEVLASYPQGGVIIPFVGLSNGLGPILAARTSWPVINVPAGTDHHDLHSSLALPSEVPAMTITNFKNAILAALNILAQKNPAAYMRRQFSLESLEEN